ncbi:TonB-dependent receptor plug domain-containing protein [Verrucomicrobium spinosum]|uniref:TonB-dependent receptor plug domain-containing protein n=1 Tax=Verrucomicrobium spinosum TaxID=2736 RepID=UPI000AD60868|nr:TonB-dependent receptor plug domain-containing protein [Verrucomicrobium spinosum]
MSLSIHSRFVIASSLAVAIAAPLAGQEAPTELDAVTVVGKAEDLLGAAPAASEGRASSEDLLSRPILRRGEILETIPGVIITQHAGGGKANQYFLRGYNLDHGTDFATSLDGMPLNMRTHAHGQGYTDLNGVIPELVERLDYVKGTYTAANGDLSTAGGANFLLFKHLERNQATFEIGEDNYYRGLIAGSIRLDTPVAPADGGVVNAKNAGKNPQPVAPVDPDVTESLTYALEYNTYDGPWVLPEDFERWNGLLRYFKGDEDNWFTATLMGYHGEWRSSDQIPQRAVKDGRIDRLGTVDPTTGGHSQRYSLNLAFQTTEGDVVTTGNVYGIHYDLDLYSNFTYFLDYPDRGDQFQQKEERWIIGGNLARTWKNQEFFGTPADYTLGFQTRHDLIDPIGLYRTEARRRFATVREDEVYESSYSVYADSTARWTDWFRTNIGVRGDVFYFDTSQSTLAANEGSEWDASSARNSAPSSARGRRRSSISTTAWASTATMRVG